MCIRDRYKTKSRNIIALAGELVEKHGGQVPEDYDELVKLPGVGRKTANVVLAVGFGHQRIAVDTHVFRLANRIGLVKEKDCLLYTSLIPSPTNMAGPISSLMALSVSSLPSGRSWA